MSHKTVFYKLTENVQLTYFQTLLAYKYNESFPLGFYSSEDSQGLGILHLGGQKKELHFLRSESTRIIFMN